MSVYIWTVSNTRQLIAAVKSHTILYRKCHADYSDDKKRAIAWEAVGLILIPTCSGRAAQLKFKRLQGAYTRQRRLPDIVKSNGRFYEDLMFLHEHVIARPKSIKVSKITTNVPVGGGKRALEHIHEAEYGRGSVRVVQSVIGKNINVQKQSEAAVATCSSKQAPHARFRGAANVFRFAFELLPDEAKLPCMIDMLRVADMYRTGKKVRIVDI